MDRITEVTRECLDALIQMRRLSPEALPKPEALRSQLRHFVDGVFTRAAQSGYSREDANDIAYAIVALADEIILSRSEELRSAWAGESLQLHYFKENVAGENFFTRLAAIRKDPRRRDILQIYFLALALGFEGRYRMRGGELELLSLTEELEGTLRQVRRFDGEVISPSGERPEDAHRSGPKRRLLLLGAAGTLLVALLLYGGLRLALSTSESSVEARIDSTHLR
jgi:type VI secretion system protein ImpK